MTGISPADRTERQQEQESSKVQENISSLPSAPEREELQDIKVFDVYERFPDDFGHIGREKDLEKLDVEKAVSDMRKDKMLEQYQFFVEAGQTDNVLFGSEDGIVIRKE
jgi:hypothetical protein